MGVASEVHAVLALCTGIGDLRERLGRIRIGYTYDGEPVTADDLQAAGAMTALLTEAIKPNLVQTTEGTGAFVHCGPFANIAHGASSVLADFIALKLSDYVVTEAGFGADCGAEKFFNVKCRSSGLRCDASVVVASVRALKMHGGAFECRPGRPLPEEQIAREDLDALARGAENLQKHIENMHLFGVPAVVAVNHFPTDTQAELDLLEKLAADAGADAVAISDAWAEGGAGAADLAQAVVEATQRPSDFRPLYALDLPTQDKIEAIATTIYGADGVHYYPAAEAQLQRLAAEGLDNLPICMAKTQYSLSHDSSLLGRPRGFTVPVLDIRLSLGAGFLYALLGDISTLPALPTKPAAHNIDVDEQGRIVGLF
jgi:formate--tetrahydrofolate ligase